MMAADDLLPARMGRMAVFARVVEARSFSAAARMLGLTKSAVSKQVARLEAELGVRLLHRTTRSLSLTEAGRAVAAHAAQAVALVREASGAVADLNDAPRGLVRMTAPVSFGKSCLAPRLPALLAAHPELRIQLVLLDRPVDLAEEGYDLAIRLTRTLPQGVVARPLMRIGYLLCAAPAYLARVRGPRAPGDLAALNCLRYEAAGRPERWRFERAGETAAVGVTGNLSINNSEALREAALAGLGVALLPEYAVRGDVAAGRLRALCPRWQAQAPFGTTAHAVWHPDRQLPPKTRACVDFLAQALGAPPPPLRRARA